MMFNVLQCHAGRIETRYRRRLRTNGGRLEAVDPHHQSDKWFLGRTASRTRRTDSRRTSTSTNEASSTTISTGKHSTPTDSSRSGTQTTSSGTSAKKRSSSSRNSSSVSSDTTTASSSKTRTSGTGSKTTGDSTFSTGSSSTKSDVDSSSSSHSTRSSAGATSSTSNDEISSSSSHTIRDDSRTSKETESQPWDESEPPYSIPSADPTASSEISSYIECRVTQVNGDFGNTMAERREVAFHYEVEMVPEATSDSLDAVLLPIIESTIADRIIAVFFEDCSEARRALKRDESEALCEANGYSSLPVDSIRLGANCTGVRFDRLSNCFVVDGGLRLYFDSVSTCPDASIRTRQVIKTDMVNGAFNELDDRIVSVTYVEDSALGLDSPTVDVVQGSDTVSEESSGLPNYTWGIIALGSILVVLIIALFVRYRKLKRREFELRSDLESTYDYDSVGLEEQACTE